MNTNDENPPVGTDATARIRQIENELSDARRVRTWARGNLVNSILPAARLDYLRNVYGLACKTVKAREAELESALNALY